MIHMLMKNRAARLSLLRWAPLLSAATGPALAQPAAPAASPAIAPALEQVVVTAQHKPEFAKNVPFAVTSLSSKTVDMLTADGEDIRVLSAQVPSLYIESSFGRIYPRFYIRGLGNSDFTYNAQQPVSVVYDDVPVENAVLKSFPMFDVQDVEVLRGPQGTLFGRNTPAGVVKIDTKKPTDDYTGYLDVSYGTYNTTNVTAVVGGPIVPQKLDFRISILEERRDDWVTNINPFDMYRKHLEGYQDFAARGQLLLKPTDDIDALWEVDGRDLDGTARLFRADIIEPGTNRLVPGFKIDEINTNGDNYQYLGSFGTHFTVNDDFGPVRLTSISAWEHGDTNSRGDVSGGNFYTLPNGAPRPGDTTGPGFADETSDAIPSLDQLTQEIRLATTGDGPFFNQGGVFAFHENLRVDSNDYLQTGVVDISLNQRQATTSFGVFDSATYKITPDLTFGAGVRLSTDHKVYTVACSNIGPSSCAPPLQPTAKTNYTGPTYNVDVTYALTPSINIYGRIASGYLAPALDGRNVEYDFGNRAEGNFTEARAETTTSYEIGMKSNLLDNRARLNLTLYRWDTHDLQLTAVGGTFNSTQLLNAKNSIGQGFESEAEFLPIDNLLLAASASYNFTEIKDPNLESSGCGFSTITGGRLCTIEDAYDPATGNYHINGNPLPNAPRWVIDASARYTMPVADGKDVYVLTDWSYRSDVNFFLYRAVEFTGMSLVQGGLRIGYEDHTRGIEVAGFVRNILDQVRITGAIDFDNLTGFVNDPRTFGIEGRVKF
jgi:iron complex outermembrane receptor protein